MIIFNDSINANGLVIIAKCLLLLTYVPLDTAVAELCLVFSSSFCQSYDMKQHSTKVFRDIVNALGSFIQSLFIVPNMGNTAAIGAPAGQSVNSIKSIAELTNTKLSSLLLTFITSDETVIEYSAYLEMYFNGKKTYFMCRNAHVMDILYLIPL